MSDAGSPQLWRKRAARGERASSAGAIVEGRQQPPGDARKRIVMFLVLTLLFTAVSASLAIGIGTEGDAGDLIALGVMWSPGLAAFATVFAFQRNFRGMG